MGRLENKVAVVTGAGAALARIGALAREPWVLVAGVNGGRATGRGQVERRRALSFMRTSRSAGTQGDGPAEEELGQLGVSSTTPASSGRRLRPRDRRETWTWSCA
jgi:hypothetical protein